MEIYLSGFKNIVAT